MKLPTNSCHSSRFGVFQQLGLAALGALLLLGGCATEVGNHTLIGKTVYPAKTKDAPIDVYTNGLPTRQFERVALLDVRCESQAFMTPNLEKDALPVLIKHARDAGCDGIIEVQERNPDQNWTFETRVKQFTAVGIVYK